MNLKNTHRDLVQKAEIKNGLILKIKIFVIECLIYFEK